MVRKAIIPAAGLGTRLLPLTASQPKEMVACGPAPVIAYVLDELHAAGITDVILVSRSGKPALEEYVFEHSPGACVIRQSEQKGLGHAVNLARRWVGDEAFVVANGDTIIHSPAGQTPLLRMLCNRTASDASVVMVQAVPLNLVDRYGIVAPRSPAGQGGVSSAPNGVFSVQDIIEKPSPDRAPSRLAIAGRYVFTPAIFDAIDAVAPDRRGEIQLAEAMRQLCRDQTMFAMPMQGGERRFDIGSLETYYEAFAALAGLTGSRSGSGEETAEPRS